MPVLLTRVPPSPGIRKVPSTALRVGAEVRHVPTVVELRPEGVVEREGGIAGDRGHVLPGELNDLAVLLAPEEDALGREDLVAGGKTRRELDEGIFLDVAPERDVAAVVDPGVLGEVERIAPRRAVPGPHDLGDLMLLVHGEDAEAQTARAAGAEIRLDQAGEGDGPAVVHAGPEVVAVEGPTARCRRSGEQLDRDARTWRVAIEACIQSEECGEGEAVAMDHEGCFPGIVVRHGPQEDGSVGPAVGAGVAGAGERDELPLGIGEKDAFDAARGQVGTEGHLASVVDLAGLEVEGEADTVVPAAHGRCVPAQFGERLKRVAAAE